MKIKKLFCILIPELSNKYWFFVLFVIGSLFRKMVPSILSDYVFKIKKNNIKFEEERREIFFDIVCNIICDLLTGILHCLSEKYNPKSTKKRKKKTLINNKKDLRIKYIHYERPNYTSNLLKHIFIISLIDFICQMLFFGNCIYKNSEYFNVSNVSNTIIRNDDHLYSFLVIDIISRYIFSCLLLKTYFYTHHYLSFTLNLIAIIIFFYIDIMFKFSEYSIIYIIMIIIRYILYSLEDIINKLILIYFFINPETLLFYKGLFSLIYLVIFTLVLIIFDKFNFPELDLKFLANIFCRLYFIFFNIIRSIFIVKVIDVFSSQHISFLRVLETIFLFIFYKIDSNCKEAIIKEKKDTNIFDNYFHLGILYEWIEVGGFLILLFSTLIHNEIIILNCKRYKKYTMYFLKIEADNEKKNLHLNENSTIDIVDENSIDNTGTFSSINEASINDPSITNTVSF